MVYSSTHFLINFACGHTKGQNYRIKSHCHMKRYVCCNLEQTRKWTLVKQGIRYSHGGYTYSVASGNVIWETAVNTFLPTHRIIQTSHLSRSKTTINNSLRLTANTNITHSCMWTYNLSTQLQLCIPPLVIFRFLVSGFWFPITY